MKIKQAHLDSGQEPSCGSADGNVHLRNIMVTFSKRVFVAASLFAACLFAGSQEAKAEFWPGWRGPRADGTSIEKNVPSNWDPTNAVWKVELPGQGHASASVWGDRICTVTAFPEKQERVLLCLDRLSGKLLWQQTVVQGPLEKIHKENSYASSTPAIDGERVYATFRVGDDIVVACHDLATGKQLWMVKPGTPCWRMGIQ